MTTATYERRRLDKLQRLIAREARRHRVRCHETGELFESEASAAAWLCRMWRRKTATASRIVSAVKTGHACGGLHWHRPWREWTPQVRHRAGRKVRRLSDGAEFENQAEAAKAAGVPKTTFVMCVRAGAPAGGSYWEYVTA